MGVIRCCRGCKPPKRNPYCHSTCPEYLNEKAEYEAMKAVADKNQRLAHGLKSQRDSAVFKAFKKWKVN